MPSLYATEEIDRLIARKKYHRAEKLLLGLLAERPRNVRLRQQLADLQARAGQPGEALEILEGLADQFAADGFAAKAIAVVKKMQRIDPRREDLDERLAVLIEGQVRQAAGARAPTAAAGGGPAEPPETAAEVPSAIRDSPLFAPFSRPELLAVIRGLRLLAVEPGEIIISEGESGSSLFVLASGAVRVYARDSGGHNRQVGSLAAGEFFGEMSLLSGKPRAATVTAAEACEILELDRDTVAAIRREHPQVWEILQEHWVHRAALTAEGGAGEGGARAG